MDQLKYTPGGQQTTTLSVQAIKSGVDYSGQFNLSSDIRSLQNELVCSPAVLLYFIKDQNCFKDFNVYNALVGTLAENGFTYSVFPA